MLIRSRLALFIVIAILPAIIALVSINSFFVLTSILVVLICGKSLVKLCIANFGSNKALREMDRRFSEHRTPTEYMRKTHRMAVFLLNLLFIFFFIYVCYDCTHTALKIVAALVVANWIYDMLRTFKPQPETEEERKTWTVSNTLSEIFVWVHNILTIGVVGTALVIAFF